MEESRQDGADEWSIEGGDSGLSLTRGVEAQDEVRQCGDEASDSAPEAGFQVSKGNSNQKQKSKERIIDENCLESYMK